MGAKGWVRLLCASLVAGAGCSQKVDPPKQARTAAASDIDPVTDYDQVEDAQSKAGGFLKKAVSAHLLKREAAGVKPSLASDFRARFAAVEEGKRLDEDGLVITDFSGANVPESDAAGFVDRLQALAGRYSDITRSQFRCFTFLLDKGGQRARGLYHWWLSGKGPEGRRLEVQGDFAVDFAGPVGDWKIRRIEFPAPSGALIESSRLAFADITDPTGFEFAYSAEGRAALQGVIDNRTMTNVGALSACDWNRDGFPDLIATNENRRTVLFLNDGQGGFTPTELPEQGGLFYLFLDLDGDGVEEIVVPHYLKNDFGLSILKRSRPDSADVWIEHPIRYPAIGGRPKAASIGDIDLDGRPDLVLSSEQASGSKRGIVWLRFRASPLDPDWDVADVSGPEGVKFDLNLLLDVDADGDLDVINSEENDNARDGKAGLGVVWYENPTR